MVRPARVVAAVLFVATWFLVQQLQESLLAAPAPRLAARIVQPLNRTEAIIGGSIRVACIGDSITEPAGRRCGRKPQVTHYPCALRALLGPQYEVRTFGCSKATGHDSGGRAWTRKCAAKRREALAFDPHVVIALFGTNDAMPEFSRGENSASLGTRLAADLNATLQEFRAVASEQQMLLCLPPPQTRHTWYDPPMVGGLPIEDWREHHETLQRVVSPALRGLASALPRTSRPGCPSTAASTGAATGTGMGAGSTPTSDVDVELVDLSKVVPVDDRYFADGLHPNSEGATLLAKALAPRIEARGLVAHPSRAVTCTPCTARELFPGPRCHADGGQVRRES